MPGSSARPKTAPAKKTATKKSSAASAGASAEEKTEKIISVS